MDDIAFSDWPGQPVDLAGSNPWLPAYGYQPPSSLLDKDDFIGNPDAALFLQGGSGTHYVFLETIVEETSDDLRSESDRSGSRASPVGWLATDSESGSVIHVDLEGMDDIDSGSESEIACPAKRRRQDPTLLSIPGIFSDSDSNHSLSRSSSLLQFETLEKHCQDQDIYSSSPSILSLFSQDSLEQQRKSNDLSPDSLERCHSDSESESDYYKTLKVDSATMSKTKRYRDSLFYNTKRLSDSDKSDSDSQDSDETLQVASRSNSCKSVQNLKSCRSFDSLSVKNNKKEKMSAENLSEDSGYSDHLCNYMKNKSSSIPNMQVQGIVVPEKSTNKPTYELKRMNIRNNSNEDINIYRLKNIKISDGFDAYDNAEGFQSFASHFGSSYQDLTVFEKYEPLAGFRTALIDRFMLCGAAAGKRTNDWCRVPQTDVLNIVPASECSAAAKISVLSSASEPNLLQQPSAADALHQATLSGDSVCVSSVPKDLNLLNNNSWNFSSSVTNNQTSIAAKNWDLADLKSELKTETCLLEFTDNFVEEDASVIEAIDKMAANVYRQEGSNVTAMIRERESSSVSSGSDISVPRYRREGSYVKAISEYLDITEITDDEQSCVADSYQDSNASTKILDIESRIEKAISETSIQSFTDDTTKLRLMFHSTPINKRNVTSTPNLSSINCEKTLFEDKNDMRRSMQNVPRKSSLVDRSASSSGVSEPDDKTITSKTFSGSGSTTKGVHFCPIVSEVSWRDSSSTESMSSYSISSIAHETTPEPTPPPVKPPRRSDMPPRTPPRKSSSQPELPQSTDKETEYIFIPLNPQKWASSSPNVTERTENTLNDNDKKQQYQQQQKQLLGVVEGGRAAPRHVVRPPQSHSTAAAVAPSTAIAKSVAAMDAVPAVVPQSPPPKPARNKLSGFLNRFASFRFSTRKSHDDKAKKKSNSVSEKKTPSSPGMVHHQPVATEKDYIYIPLKGPLPPGLASRETQINGKSKVIEVVKSDNNNVVKCISAKPPLPRVPPRVVSACVKRRVAEGGGGESIAPRPSVALAVSAAGRHAGSMEPMGLIETDLDTEVTVITAGAAPCNAKTRSLMNLGDAEPPPRALLAISDTASRPHKSMEFLLDKQNLKQVEPPENELQKGTGERVMSEHQLRVQRSLQKLTVPDWYKSAQVPREGFILKKQRQEPRWTGTGTANNSKTPSLSSLGSGHSPVLLSPTPHAQQQPFTRWSTSKLNSAASSPCASTRSSFNHRTSNGGISPISVRSSFSYRQPYLGWRSQERLTRPRTPAERLATSLLPANPPPVDDNPEIQTSIKEVTSAIVHYVSGLKPDQGDRNSLSPTSSPRLGSRFDQDNSSQRSASPQSRGSQKLCWLESSFVGTRPLDSPQTPVSLSGGDTANPSPLPMPMPVGPPTTLRLDLQKNINNGESLRA